MSPTAQFWMDWVVQAASAVGTLGAVVVALFGGRLQRLLFRPRLSIRTADVPCVRAGYSAAAEDGGTLETEAYWHHGVVENPARWPAVTQVQVFLRQIEELDQFGQPQAVWAGDTVLQWSNKGDRPLLLNIGHASHFDLFSVVKLGYLEIHPLAPLEKQKTRWKPPVHIFLVVQARGIEGDSPPARVEIKWNGQWPEDRADMKLSVGIKQLPSPQVTTRQA